MERRPGTPQEWESLLASEGMAADLHEDAGEEPAASEFSSAERRELTASDRQAVLRAMQRYWSVAGARSHGSHEAAMTEVAIELHLDPEKIPMDWAKRAQEQIRLVEMACEAWLDEKTAAAIEAAHGGIEVSLRRQMLKEFEGLDSDAIKTVVEAKVARRLR